MWEQMPPSCDQTMAQVFNTFLGGNEGLAPSLVIY